MTEFEKIIENTKNYIDYVENHYNNVQRLLRNLQEDYQAQKGIKSMISLYGI